ncbi:hypothetical protein ElyMa_000055300 [Elysia marginata]|uniref:Uncharacterized protein n=1 Tax=Elysia marginata TaxID=1093978 RepID=A0AAV4EGM0_9GAST|nr:hypothetical protein ElyMa_000055300 [Elysia marginata]
MDNSRLVNTQNCAAIFSNVFIRSPTPARDVAPGQVVATNETGQGLQTSDPGKSETEPGGFLRRFGLTAVSRFSCQGTFRTQVPNLIMDSGKSNSDNGYYILPLLTSITPVTGWVFTHLSYRD